MFWMIYNFYVDSWIFVRKNIFVIFPFFIYVNGYYLLGIWLQKDSLLNNLFSIILPILYYFLIETYAVVVVYKKEMLFDLEESTLQIINRFSGKFLLLTFTSGFILAFSLIIYLDFFRKNDFALEKPIFTFMEFFFGTAYLLSLRHLLYYDPGLVMDSMKAGVIGLYKNFFFYLFLVLLGRVFTRYPSVLFPVSWAIFPFLPIAEFNGTMVYGGGINWFSLIINPILFAVASIALTYAFLAKNQKDKHVS